MLRKRLTKIVAAIALILASSVPLLAEDYPSHPISFVVGFAPGGGTDLVARLISKELQERLRQPVVVENRSGAGGQIALNYVAKSPADGYRVTFGSAATLAMAYGTMKEKLPYDPNGFAPIARVVDIPFVLIVNPAIPVTDLRSFIDYAKGQQQPLKMATTGAGTNHHVYAAMLSEMSGFKFLPVAYRGSQPAMTDVLAGHIPCMFIDLATALPLIQDGKLRAIGVSTKNRVAAAPDIPSLAEAGLPDFDAASWFVVVAPLGTPSTTLDRLHAELKAVMAMPEIQKAVIDMGMVPVDSAGMDDLRSFIRKEVNRWTELIDRIGIKPE